MKTGKISFVVVMFAISTLLLGSCVQSNYYDTAPYGNNNYGNHTDYIYTFTENFNSTDLYGWNFTSAYDSAYGTITKGNYQYVNYGYSQSNMSVVNTGVTFLNNFTVKTDIYSNNTMGLIFGASATSNGYAFFIDVDGYYALYKEGSGGYASIPIIPFTSGLPYAVKNGWNALEVDQTGGTWTGFINGTKVFSIAARNLSGNSFGFKVLPGTVGYADYLEVNCY